MGTRERRRPLNSYRFTRNAKADFRESVAFIRSASGMAAAKAFVKRIREACTRLAALPRSGRACPDLGWRLRSFPVGRYTLFFRPMGSGIQVIRLLHQSRDIEAELAKRRAS